MTELPRTVEEMMELLKSAPPAQLAQFRRMAEPLTNQLWLPQPGPQYAAFHSEADELLYGGAAGGGKSDLLIGLATTVHKRSVLFRRQSTDLDGMWERLKEVAGTSALSTNDQKRRMVMAGGRVIEGGHLEKPGSEKSWMGRPHDFIGIDEGAQLDDYKVAFVSRWLRSAEGMRCRLIIATNPPIPEYRDGKMIDYGTGAWLKEWFAPWLNPAFSFQAEPGELVWCFMRSTGNRTETCWVEGPGFYDPETLEPVQNPSRNAVETGKVVAAKSRTFIKSLLKDNAYLRGTGYAERLSSTPEPLKSMLLNGEFTVRVEDSPMQVIPTNWVQQAVARWHDRQHELKHLKQLVIGADVAQGGADSAVYAPLYETDMFGELKSYPGRDTPDGPAIVMQLLAHRKDKSLIVLDGTGGWAGDAYRTLQERHNIHAELCVASKGSQEWTEDMMFKMANVRSAMWWAFRNALNPESRYDVALPPDPRLEAQLTAPTWFVRGKELFVEGKDDLRKRLGSSTDEADPVLMAWFYRDQAIADRARRRVELVDKYNDPDYDPRNPDAIHEKEFDLDDPLKDW